MKVSLATRTAGVVAVAALGLAACGSNSNGTSANNQPSTGTSSSGSSMCGSGSVTGQGSTFQQNIEKQWIANYTQQCSGAQITYTGTGSGAGISQFGSGTIDFAGSDVTMKPAEKAGADKACGSPSLTIPITAGGVAILYNLPGVSNLQLSAGTLAQIFEGKIKTWNDPKIAADNSGTKLPSTTIKTYHRSDGSGTTSVLSSFLDSVAKSDWTLGTGKTLTWPSGQGASGSSGVSAGVKATAGGITYAEVSFATQTGLPTAKIKGAAGDYQSISSQTVSDAINSGFSVTGTGNDLAGSLDFTKMTGYPISTVSYAIVCSKYKDSAKGTLIKDYLSYAVTTGQGQADQLGFAPLPASLVTKDQASISSIS